MNRFNGRINYPPGNRRSRGVCPVPGHPRQRNSRPAFQGVPLFQILLQAPSLKATAILTSRSRSVIWGTHGITPASPSCLTHSRPLNVETFFLAAITGCSNECELFRLAARSERGEFADCVLFDSSGFVIFPKLRVASWLPVRCEPHLCSSGFRKLRSIALFPFSQNRS